MPAGGLAGLKAERGTALYDTIVFSLFYYSGLKGQRAMLLLSDGKDEGSRFSFDDALDYARRAGVTIYTIGLGPKVDRDFLQKVANLSSGESYFPDDVEGLRDDYRRVVENLRRRYVVSYTSTNGVRDGSWRRVDIRPRPDDVVVRSRGGYFAPER